MSSAIVKSIKYQINKCQKNKNKKNRNTAYDPQEFKNLQGWFEFGKRDEQKKLCKLIKWPLHGPWLLHGRQCPIWMCNDTKWLVSNSIRVCQPPYQIMSCRDSAVGILHAASEGAEWLWTWRRKRQINFRIRNFQVCGDVFRHRDTHSSVDWHEGGIASLVGFFNCPTAAMPWCDGSSRYALRQPRRRVLLFPQWENLHPLEASLPPSLQQLFEFVFTPHLQAWYINKTKVEKGEQTSSPVMNGGDQSDSCCGKRIINQPEIK